jgi:hypothetical protein
MRGFGDDSFSNAQINNASAGRDVRSYLIVRPSEYIGLMDTFL